MRSYIIVIALGIALACFATLYFIKPRTITIIEREEIIPDKVTIRYVTSPPDTIYVHIGERLSVVRDSLLHVVAVEDREVVASIKDCLVESRRTFYKEIKGATVQSKVVVWSPTNIHLISNAIDIDIDQDMFNRTIQRRIDIEKATSMKKGIIYGAGGVAIVVICLALLI